MEQRWVCCTHMSCMAYRTLGVNYCDMSSIFNCSHIIYKNCKLILFLSSYSVLSKIDNTHLSFIFFFSLLLLGVFSFNFVYKRLAIHKQSIFLSIQPSVNRTVNRYLHSSSPGFLSSILFNCLSNLNLLILMFVNGLNKMFNILILISLTVIMNV